MSRIGSKPVLIPDDVNVALAGKDLTVKGSRGELSMRFVDDVVVSHEDNAIVVKPR